LRLFLIEPAARSNGPQAEEEADRECSGHERREGRLGEDEEHDERHREAAQADGEPPGRTLALQHEREGEDGVREKEHEHDPGPADGHLRGEGDDAREGQPDQCQQREPVNEEEAHAIGHGAHGLDHHAILPEARGPTDRPECGRHIPILGRVVSLPLPDADAYGPRLEPFVDVEGKLPRTLEALGPIGGRDVVLLDTAGAWQARQLLGLGGRVVALARADRNEVLRDELSSEISAGAVTISAGTPVSSGLADDSVDVVVSFWSAFRGGSLEEVAEAERILRPGGRLLVVHEYARDDLARLWPAERSEELVAWSRRDGWFLGHDFKIRVIHAFWTFPDLATLREIGEALFGPEAAPLLADLRRPRLSWKLVVYHRTRVAQNGAIGARGARGDGVVGG
jgi:SAM-dependent methyltransferase